MVVHPWEPLKPALDPMTTADLAALRGELVRLALALLTPHPEHVEAVRLELLKLAERLPC